MTQQQSTVDTFFANNAGGLGAPSFKFEVLQDGLMGAIVDLRVSQQTKFGSNPPVVLLDEVTGQPLEQLEVTIQTPLRGWQKCTPPTDKAVMPNGQTVDQVRDPSLDDGKRRIFLKGNMLYVVGQQVHQAGKAGLEIGGTLGVKYVSERDTGKGNPAKQFEARYAPPSVQFAVPAPQQPQYAPQPPVQPQPQAPVQPQYAPQQPVQQVQQPQYVPQAPQPQYAPAPPQQDPWAASTPLPAAPGDPWATPVNPGVPAPPF